MKNFTTTIMSLLGTRETSWMKILPNNYEFTRYAWDVLDEDFNQENTFTRYAWDVLDEDFTQENTFTRYAWEILTKKTRLRGTREKF